MNVEIGRSKFSFKFYNSYGLPRDKIDCTLEALMNMEMKDEFHL